MKIGMLWYDDDKQRTLAEKVKRAADYYKEKYEVAPSLCYVHPSALEGVEFQENGVALRAAPNVRPNHFWVGLDDAKPKSNGHRTT